MFLLIPSAFYLFVEMALGWSLCFRPVARRLGTAANQVEFDNKSVDQQCVPMGEVASVGHDRGFSGEEEYVVVYGKSELEASTLPDKKTKRKRKKKKKISD